MYNFARSLPLFLALAVATGCPDGSGGSQGAARNGKGEVTVTYHSNGAKAAEGPMVGGKKSGTWVYWDANGKVIRSEQWTAGALIDDMGDSGGASGADSSGAGLGERLGDDADRGAGESDGLK